MPKVKLEPFGVNVSCADGESILDATLRDGYYLRYGCKSGGCATCKALLVEGDADDTGSTFALPSSARAEGWILLCASTPLDDCVVDVSAMGLAAAEFLGGDQTATIETTLEFVEKLTPTIYGVRLRLTDPMSFLFTAGQFVNVEVPGFASTGRRAFSIANAPSDNTHVELNVRRLPGGRFGTYLDSAARSGDVILLQGPLGSLRVRPSYRKIIMVAGGTGLAPLTSMLTDLAEKRDPRAAVLFFGARTPDELYHMKRIEQLCGVSALLEFVPVVQQPTADWMGEVGLVTEAIARRMVSLKGYDAYLCGPPQMVQAARRTVLTLGVREPNVYYDAFVPTGNESATAPVP
jgi:NAD(P)H-flavin reductase/ferredoxin